MLSTATLIDHAGRAVTRDGVLPDAVNEANGLVFVSERGTSTGLGAFTQTLSIPARVDSGGGVVVCDTQCRVRRLDVTLTPDANALVPLFAQVYNGGSSFYAPPDFVLPFFPVNGLPYTKRLDLEDTLFSLGCYVRFQTVPYSGPFFAFLNAGVFQVSALVGLV